MLHCHAETLGLAHLWFCLRAYHQAQTGCVLSASGGQVVAITVANKSAHTLVSAVATTLGYWPVVLGWR